MTTSSTNSSVSVNSVGRQSWTESTKRKLQTRIARISLIMADEEQYPVRPPAEAVPQENDQAAALPQAVQPELPRQQGPDDIEVFLCIFFTVNIVVLVCTVYVPAWPLHGFIWFMGTHLT